MTRKTDNTAALRAHKADSQKETRLELELAVRRLVNGNPQRVKKGTPLSPLAVAEEAGVNRTTLYRYHEPVLTEIRRILESSSQQKLRAKSTELTAAKAKAREYREMLEAEQANLLTMARENFNLKARLKELESSVERQTARIVELEEAQKKVTSISTKRPRGD